MTEIEKIRKAEKKSHEEIYIQDMSDLKREVG